MIKNSRDYCYFRVGYFGYYILVLITLSNYIFLVACCLPELNHRIPPLAILLMIYNLSFIEIWFVIPSLYCKQKHFKASQFGKWLVQYISKLRCPLIKTKTQQNHNKITTKQNKNKNATESQQNHNKTK